MKPQRGRQSGAALLALVFVVVAASTYLLVLRLNASTRPYLREQRSVSVLQEAKQALIAYAVNYPNDHPTFGPGYLPCPDREDPTIPKDDPNYATKVGVASNGCALSTGSSVGRFPWKTLKTGDIRDQNGERPWYAVSDNFRSNPKLEPMNSDVSTVAGYYDDDLVVDGEDDIAAVVFVPGVPMDGQERDTVTNLLDVTNYLDGVNADGDTDFSSRAGNDRLVYITRQELMQAIEKRVLGDLAKTLDRYYQDVGVYPWLANFVPTSADHDAVTNVREGYLAYNDINEVFPTQFSVNWNITDGPPFTMTPTAVMPDWNSFPPITVNQATPFSVTGSPECTWTTREEITCNGRFTETINNTLIIFGWTFVQTATRVFDFSLNIPAGGTINVSSATMSIRTRDLFIEANTPSTFPAGTSTMVNITESGEYEICSIPPLTCFTIPYSSSDANEITPSRHGNITVTGITYDLGSEDEVPEWFITNNWHKLMLIAYSSGDAPDNAGPCIPAGTPACITVAGTATPTNNKHALVISAGFDLNANRPSSDMLDYFELENGDTGDDEFIKGAITSDFNDQVRVLR